MAAPTNTAYKGRDLLIKVSTGASPTAYNTLLGVRSNTITINNEMVDITDSDNAPYRQLLGDAGLRSLSLSASGIAKDDNAYQDVQDYAHTGARQSFLIQFGNGDIIEGEFLVTSLEEAGEYNGAQTYSISLESSGTWNFQRA